MTVRLSLGEKPVAETDTFCGDESPVFGVIVTFCTPAAGAVGPGAVEEGDVVAEVVAGGAADLELLHPAARSAASPTTAAAAHHNPGLNLVTATCWRARSRYGSSARRGMAMSWRA
jgi:hypothetical protein